MKPVAYENITEDWESPVWKQGNNRGTPIFSVTGTFDGADVELLYVQPVTGIEIPLAPAFTADSVYPVVGVNPGTRIRMKVSSAGASTDLTLALG